jgi:hypothetical protein
MRVHQNGLKPRGELHAGVFRGRKGGMSTDWSRYATPEETRQRATSPPEHNGVVGLPVGGVREIQGLRVVHDPKDDNQAHTEVRGGVARAEVRLKLLRICEVLIAVPWPPEE